MTPARARANRAEARAKSVMQSMAKTLTDPSRLSAEGRADAEPILQAMEAFDSDARQLNARQHRAEAWRDHLVENGDSALGDLLQLRHGADAQAIRQLLRTARSEAARGKPPAAARALFRLLRDMDAGESLPPIAKIQR